jgi:ubiquinone/menaquinone biosynthesis C-methylase UbiE
MYALEERSPVLEGEGQSTADSSNQRNLALSLDELPETWVDQLRLNRPRDLLRLIRHIGGKRHRAVPPASVTSNHTIPSYLLAEYHGLPNGYFSKHFTHGYIRTFDKVMLGTMTQLRERIAECFSGHERVLDIGCGGGNQAALLADSGIPAVHAIDASPYMVAHAMQSYPHIPFVVANAESTGFADMEFDAVCLSFVFHEIPPTFAEQALAEIHRILKPGGDIIIAEPSSLQMTESRRDLYRRFGWRGVYFKSLAGHMREPFLAPWHARDHVQWLAGHGFSVLEEEQSCPIHWWRARKQ